LCILGQLCRIPTWARRFNAHPPSLETQTLLTTHNRPMSSSVGKLWDIALSHLLDVNESCVIRVQAVHLLLNLTALPMNPRHSGIFLPPSANQTEQPNGLRPSVSETLRRSLARGSINSTVAELSTQAARRLQSNEREDPDDSTETTTGRDASDETSSVCDRMSAGDRPTATTNDDNDDSSTIDLRLLFNSDLESSEIRNNFAELIQYLQPWFNELFPAAQIERENGEQPPNTNWDLVADNVGVEREGILDPDQVARSALLFHMSSVPRNTLLPCFFNSDGGFYLLGLPALQQLLISLHVLDYLHQLLGTYLPQPLFDPIRWYGLTVSSSRTLTDFPDSVDSELRVGGLATEQSNRQIAGSGTQVASTNSNPNVICTPLLAGAVCQLLVNLLHHLPKFVPAELIRLRIHALLMNVVDPNLLEVVVCGLQTSGGGDSSFSPSTCSPSTPLGRQSPWFVGHKHLVQCFASCLRVLRCQAAMHLATRSALKSDALFLVRLIRSVKNYNHLEVWAPMWHEMFALITCLLLGSDPSDASGDLNVRLILQPLSTRVDCWLEILLALIDRAEMRLNADQSRWSHVRNSSQLCCKQARSALNFFIVVLSHHRPLSLNPVIEALDALHHPEAKALQLVEPDSSSKHNLLVKDASSRQKQPNVVVRLTRRLMTLVSSSSVLLDKTCEVQSVHLTTYRRSLRSALQTLLGCCRSAKAVALEDGILEELVVSTQLLQAKLDLCGLTAAMETNIIDSGAARSRSLGLLSERKKQQTVRQWNVLTDELIAQCEIMHNLVYIYPDARKRAIEAGLPQVMLSCL
uniref:DUF1741 domain-containing protein n=1 Tax=Echinostoma caproni TaxID=27848 RepID=A0A183B2L4_9TREM